MSASRYTLRPGFHFLLCAVAGCVITGCQTARAPEASGPLPIPKTARIPKFTKPIQIDGRLDEAAWKEAVRLTPFVQHVTQAPARVKTEVRVGYDDFALYLGWTCEDPDIQATLKARDSQFWEEEVVEFFVTPGPLERYFELQWNPLGGTFDAVITNQLGPDGQSKRYEGDWNFSAKEMTWAVAVDGTVQNSSDRDRRWTVEVRVPFSDLQQQTPKPGALWRANFYRYNRDTGQEPELLSWSPIIWPGFHQPTRFGYLEFVGSR